jgi:hypothetical protein
MNGKEIDPSCAPSQSPVEGKLRRAKSIDPFITIRPSSVKTALGDHFINQAARTLVCRLMHSDSRHQALREVSAVATEELFGIEEASR